MATLSIKYVMIRLMAAPFIGAAFLCKFLTLPTAKAGGFSAQIPMPKGRGITPHMINEKEIT